MVMQGEEESDYENDLEEVEDTKKKRKKSIVAHKDGKKAKLEDTNENESDEDLSESNQFLCFQ